jgi:hypothetical protein
MVGDISIFLSNTKGDLTMSRFSDSDLDLLVECITTARTLTPTDMENESVLLAGLLFIGKQIQESIYQIEDQLRDRLLGIDQTITMSLSQLADIVRRGDL